MEFAYVTFVNNDLNYMNLMKSTIRSIEAFSKYPIIVYLVDIPEETSPFHSTEKCILRYIKNPGLQNVYYFKPYVIIDSIKQGLKSGYYIESDDLLTPTGDSIQKFTETLDKYPISPIHERDVPISSHFMHNLGVFTKTQHYIHAHVLFKNTNLEFLEDWMSGCNRSYGECWDETVLNCMYWKYKLENHYLGLIDPFYKFFYSDPTLYKNVITIHGCKEPVEHAAILDKMIELHRAD